MAGGAGETPEAVCLWWRERHRARMRDRTRYAPALWEKLDAMVLRLCVAMQPELARRYRRTFPRAEPLGGAAATSAAAEAYDNSGRGFHLIGVDVLLDSECQPILLELNSNPSLMTLS